MQLNRKEGMGLGGCTIINFFFFLGNVKRPRPTGSDQLDSATVQLSADALFVNSSPSKEKSTSVVKYTEKSSSNNPSCQVNIIFPSSNLSWHIFFSLFHFHFNIAKVLI